MSEMNSMKTLTNALLIAFFSSVTTGSLHAEKITFSGYISEFSCSADSLDKECKDISGLLDTLKKSENTVKFSQLSNATQQKVANISIQDIEKKQHKIVVVNYN